MEEKKSINKEKKNSWKDFEVGGVWDNGKYLYIKIEDKKNGEKKIYKAFRNKFKNEDKHPDWKVYENLPELNKNRPQHPKPKKIDEEESSAFDGDDFL